MKYTNREQCGSITLRPATLADAETLLEWRNDPITRENSRRTYVMTLTDYTREIAAAIDSKNCTWLIGEIDRSPVGTIKIDDNGDWHEISYTVSPTCRGKGYAHQLVAAACEARQHVAIHAEIKPTNVQSISVVKACGFAQIEVRESLTLWRLEPLYGRNH